MAKRKRKVAGTDGLPPKRRQVTKVVDDAPPSKPHRRKRKAAGTDGLPPKRRQIKKDVDHTTTSKTQKRRAKKDRAGEGDKSSEPKYPKASFLGIPGELRNLIYRDVLLESGYRNITPNNHHYPDLIKVSKQIYRETKIIYLQENQFQIEVIDNKAVAPQAWHWVFYSKYRCIIHNSTSWANLKEWIRFWHFNKRLGVHAPNDADLKNQGYPVGARMALRAWNIANRMTLIKGLEWSALEAVLEEYKLSTEDAGFAWT